MKESKKNNFIMYESWTDTILNLPSELKCEVIDALIKYARGEDISEYGQAAKAIILPWCKEIDSNTEKYEETCEKRKENGRKGGLKKAENVAKDSKCLANGSKTKQMVSKNYQNLHDNESDSVSESDNESVSVNDLKETPSESVCKKKTSKKESPVYFPQDELLEKTFQDYIEMRKRKRAPLTDHAMDLAIKHLTELSGGDNNKAVKILENSIRNSWTDVYPLKDSPPQKELSFKERLMNA